MRDLTVANIDGSEVVRNQRNSMNLRNHIHIKESTDCRAIIKHRDVTCSVHMINETKV